jgi:hypothetical protein
MNKHNTLFFAAVLAAGAFPAFSQTVEVHADPHPDVYKVGDSICVVATLKGPGPKLENGGLSFVTKEGHGIPWDTVAFDNQPDGSYKMCGKIGRSTLEGEYRLNSLSLNQTNGFSTGYSFDADFKEVIVIRIESEVKKLPEIKRLTLVK